MTYSEKNEKQQIRDLIELNDVLENYFKNTIIPQLFVDADLVLRPYRKKVIFLIENRQGGDILLT